MRSRRVPGLARKGAPTERMQPKMESTENKPEVVKNGSVLGEFWTFLKEEKKWWLAPLLVVLLSLSAVIVFAEGSAIAPFIYSIF